MGFYARARKKVESSVEPRGCGHARRPMCMRRGGRDARARRGMGPRRRMWSLDILTSPNLLVPLRASSISHEMHHSCLELACPHLNLKESLSSLGHLRSTAKLCGTWAKRPTWGGVVVSLLHPSPVGLVSSPFLSSTCTV